MALPWEQQDDESPEAFGAFARYRDMEPEERSLTKLAEEIGKDRSLMARWSSQKAWIARCLAYDRNNDHLRRVVRAKEIEKMAERHAAAAQGLQGAAFKDLGAIRARQAESEAAAAKTKGTDFEEPPEMILTPELVLRFIDIGTRLERVARGEPETITSLELGGGDPLTQAIVNDEGVRAASRDLVRAAASAGQIEPGGASNRDEPG